MNWTEYFSQMAFLAAKKSKDPSTQVGCIIVGPDKEIRSTGFNGFPRGVADTGARLESKDGKLNFMVHAEANAVAAAARMGTSLKGCMAVVTKYPCSQCAALLIQAGVSKILTPHYHHEDRWAYSNSVSESMFNETGVKVEHY